MLEPVSSRVAGARLLAYIGRPAIIGVVLFTLVVPVRAIGAEGAVDTSRPFKIGERLTYEVSWLNLTAVIAAQGRAQSLEAAQRAAAQDQGREQLRRFLAPGASYQPTTVTMFRNR